MVVHWSELDPQKTVKNLDCIELNKSLKIPKLWWKIPWTSGNGCQRRKTRTSVKVRWPRLMETAEEAKLAVGKPGSGNRGHFWCMISAGKTPREGNTPSDRLHGSWENCGESAKVKGGTCAPKPAVYRGHHWAVSAFGEKQIIPFSAWRVACGGERKPPLIAR